MSIFRQRDTRPNHPPHRPEQELTVEQPFLYKALVGPDDDVCSGRLRAVTAARRASTTSPLAMLTIEADPCLAAAFES
jgi:hypothetical protein